MKIESMSVNPGKLIELVFSDSTTSICTPNHMWFVGNNNFPVPARALKVGQDVFSEIDHNCISPMRVYPNSTLDEIRSSIATMKRELQIAEDLHNKRIALLVERHNAFLQDFNDEISEFERQAAIKESELQVKIN